MSADTAKNPAKILENLLDLVKIFLFDRLDRFGHFILYVKEVLQKMFSRPYRFHLIAQQMEFIGNQSLFIITLTGFFTGAVFGLQLGGVFTIFKAENMIGGATGIALAKELAPLIGAFLLTGRAGSAITAELATMVVNEQVDALEVMAVDPINYLVVPRVWASLIMMPLLCGVFMLIGMVGATLVSLIIYYADSGIYWEKILDLIEPSDLISGLRKMFAFAFVISVMHCYYGIHASGGAKGVGNATTTAVVSTLITLLAIDFFISYFEVVWLG